MANKKKNCVLNIGLSNSCLITTQRSFPCQESSFKLIKVPKINVHQKNGEKIKRKGKYLKKSFFIDFDTMIKPFIENAQKWEIEKDRNDICNKLYDGTIPVTDLIQIYKRRKLHNWYGYIYKITQLRNLKGVHINNGAILVGMSILKRFSSRWYWYCNDAFKKKKNATIFRMMREFVDSGEEMMKVYPFNKKGIGYLGKNRSFSYEILEICWSDGKLRVGEDEWINYFKNLYPNRVINEQKGGGGGISIFIPRWVLIPYISRGLRGSEIRDAINEKFNWNISKDVVYNRINIYWNSIGEARQKFLKPILKILMRLGYSATHLSGNVFNRDSHTISNWSNEFWDEDFKVKRRDFIKEFLSQLIMRGLDSYEMDKELRGVPWETVRKEYIPVWWNNLGRAREILIKPIIADCLSDGCSLIKIQNILNHDSMDRLIKFICIFWGIPLKNIDTRYSKVKKFRDHIIDNNLTYDLIMNLKYEDIKEDLKDYYFKKFERIYEQNPDYVKKNFLQIFSDYSLSTFYYWKNKFESKTNSFTIQS